MVRSIRGDCVSFGILDPFGGGCVRSADANANCPAMGWGRWGSTKGAAHDVRALGELWQEMEDELGIH
eukprot:6046222-Pyramimonas_sp.AAC.1